MIYVGIDVAKDKHDCFMEAFSFIHPVNHLPDTDRQKLPHLAVPTPAYLWKYIPHPAACFSTVFYFF